jgi:hypothetical protein
MRGAWKKSQRLNSAICVCALLFGAAVTIDAQEGTRPSATRKKIFLAGDKAIAYQLSDVERVQQGRQTLLRLVRRSEREPGGDDLFLNFESKTLFSNPAHQSLLIKSGLEISRHTNMSGNAGLFTLPSHLIRMKLPDYLNLSGNTQRREAGDFSFSLEIEPHAANGELLRRENFKGGRHYLFSIALVNNHVNVKLTNLLRRVGDSAETVLDSAEFNSIDKVRPQKRNQIIFAYDEAQGRLELNINGREQVVKFLKRETSDHYIVDFTPLKAAPVSLFSPFRGYADNVLFANRHLSGEDLRHYGAIEPYGDRYTQRRGSVLTEVYDMGYSASNINAIHADAEVPRDTHADWSFRCHNRRFDANLSSAALPFQPFAAAAGSKCRFVQLQAQLTADNAGEATPALKAFSLEYRENPPPERPLPPKVVKATADSVALDIMPNSELDVVKGGRYIIYYGHKPLKSEGAVYFTTTVVQGNAIKGEPIYHRVPVRVTVTNEMLSRNKHYADQNPRFKNRYPFLAPGLGYYFWVTACDSAYSDAQEFADHESAPSEPVFVRFSAAP